MKRIFALVMLLVAVCAFSMSAAGCDVSAPTSVALAPTPAFLRGVDEGTGMCASPNALALVGKFRIPNSNTGKADAEIDARQRRADYENQDRYCLNRGIENDPDWSKVSPFVLAMKNCAERLRNERVAERQRHWCDAPFIREAQPDVSYVACEARGVKRIC